MAKYLIIDRQKIKLATAAVRHGNQPQDVVTLLCMNQVEQTYLQEILKLVQEEQLKG